MTDAEEFLKKPEDESALVRQLRRDLRASNKKLRRYQTGAGIVLDAVREAISEPFDIQVPPAPKRVRKAREEIAVLHISDTQIGKVTETYSSDVARDRIENILLNKVRRTVETRRSNTKIDECRLYLGGDLVEGETIFAGQAHVIDQVVYDQAVHTAPSIIANLTLGLLDLFPRVIVRGVAGNHGRSAPRSSNASKRTNWDPVCMEMVRRILEGCGKRLDFQVSDRFYFIDRVYDWGNLLVHGDQIRGHAGFPFYGAAKKAWGWIDSLPDPWDYMWVGHFHTPVMLTLNRRIYLGNGSTESDSDFAQEQLAACGEPCQRLAFFNRDHGLVSDHPLFLRERVPERRRLERWKAEG